MRECQICYGRKAQFLLKKSIKWEGANGVDGIVYFDCPYCGRYGISSKILTFEIKSPLREELACVLYAHRLHGGRQYIVVPEQDGDDIIARNTNLRDYDGDIVTVAEMKSLFPRRPRDLYAMSMNNLSLMKDKESHPYEAVKIGWTQDYAALYARTGMDFQKTACELQAKGWIKFNGNGAVRLTTEHNRSVQLDRIGIEITDSGWEKIEKVTVKAVTQKSEMVRMTNKIFIAHGHDLKKRNEIELFIRRIGLKAIILEQQASSGKTLIEKFESEAKDTRYAIIILTPDDRGCDKKSMKKKEFKVETGFKDRARQNVIFEYGFFAGMLGRDRVTALAFGNIEWPSDISGIVYAHEDNWQNELVKDLQAAKYECKIEGMLS